MSEQQQPELYQYSVKIEMTAKGLAMPTIHVYSNDMQTARKQAVEQYSKVIEELKAKGLPVATPEFKIWVSCRYIAFVVRSGQEIFDQLSVQAL
jgi:hypothetical protein